ncbi:uncharacterized protein [Lolium perenne]|uniref:uncharacterized protein n=1 Tax=Lolium perenne TaxID=4522 RepID=UPI003A99B2CA
MARGGMASAATGPDVTPPVVEEESTDVGSTEGQKAPEVEEDIVEEGGLSEPLKECRSKAARDRAPPSDADTRTGEVPSTEAVMRADGATESRHPPPSSLTFTELHTALGEAHVAEIKRLTALVEEAAQKNRKLIALGTEAQAKALAEAREGFVKESFYREAEFRAQQAEEARKRAKAEVAELTKVLEQKGRELEDVIAEYKVKLEAATDARDSARGAAASLREEVAALKQQHAKELAAEKEASEGIVLAVQAEKTNFEAFVREMSRQILGTCDFVETATPRECLSTATARIIACAGEILAALQYLSPREVIPRDTPSVFKAVSNIPAVVDWLRRSSCRVGITMALSMVLAHYSEGFDVEEVTAGFPSDRRVRCCRSAAADGCGKPTMAAGLADSHLQHQHDIVDGGMHGSTALDGEVDDGSEARGQRLVLHLHNLLDGGIPAYANARRGRHIKRHRQQWSQPNQRLLPFAGRAKLDLCFSLSGDH